MGHVPPEPLEPVQVPSGITIGALLRQSPLDRLETHILVGFALGLSRVQLVTRSDQVLDTGQSQRINALFARRLAGEPIAYIVGEREFYGLPFYVTPDVLIPRPETELLVERALERLPVRARVLDMGTGSGAIAVAIAHARPDITVTALDASRGALDVADRNARRNGVSLRLLQSDWFAALSEEQFDLIVSNPPYINAGDPHLAQGDLRYEPVDALTDHADGLSALRTIIGGAPKFLRPGAWILVEHGYDQALQVRALLEAAGLGQAQSWCDLAGIERVTGARL